jgi:hypothetical protein
LGGRKREARVITSKRQTKKKDKTPYQEFSTSSLSTSTDIGKLAVSEGRKEDKNQQK